MRDAYIFTPTSSPSLGTFDRVRLEPIAIVPRRLGRFFAGTSAHGGAREDDGRRRRETTTGDGRRETGDARRGVERDARAETTSVSTSRRGRPWDEARRRLRCAFSTRVWARGRDSFAGHHSSWVTIRTDSANRRDESRHLDVADARGGVICVVRFRVFSKALERERERERERR